MIFRLKEDQMISQIPDYFGMKSAEKELTEYECDIFAEIVDAAWLPRKILKIAKII